MDFNPTEMRRRFAELRANRTRIEEKLAPMHAEIEELRTSTRKREDELTAKIKKTREPLVEIDREMGMISRALNGKTAEVD